MSEEQERQLQEALAKFAQAAQAFADAVAEVFRAWWEWAEKIIMPIWEWYKREKRRPYFVTPMPAYLRSSVRVRPAFTLRR